MEVTIRSSQPSLSLTVPLLGHEGNGVSGDLHLSLFISLDPNLSCVLTDDSFWSLASAHLKSEALDAFVLDCLCKDVGIADSQGREYCHLLEQRMACFLSIYKKLGCSNLRFSLL